MSDEMAALLYGGNTESDEKPEGNATPGGELTAAEKLYGPDETPEEVSRDTKPEDKSKSKEETKSEDDAKAKDDKAKDDKSDDKATPDGDPLDGVEGIDLEDPYADTFREGVKDLGLDKAGVEKLVEMKAEHDAQVWEQISDAWMTEAKADENFSENIGYAKDVLTEFADDQLLNDLDRYQLGNHPGLIRLLGRVGRELKGK